MMVYSAPSIIMVLPERRAAGKQRIRHVGADDRDVRAALILLRREVAAGREIARRDLAHVRRLARHVDVLRFEARHARRDRLAIHHRGNVELQSDVLPRNCDQRRMNSAYSGFMGRRLRSFGGSWLGSPDVL